MKRFIVRYKVKAGRAEENQDLIKKVFAAPPPEGSPG